MLKRLLCLILTDCICGFQSLYSMNSCTIIISAFLVPIIICLVLTTYGMCIEIIQIIKHQDTIPNWTKKYVVIESILVTLRKE